MDERTHGLKNARAVASLLISGAIGCQIPPAGARFVASFSRTPQIIVTPSGTAVATSPAPTFNVPNFPVGTTFTTTSPFASPFATTSFPFATPVNGFAPNALPVVPVNTVTTGTATGGAAFGSGAPFGGGGLPFGGGGAPFGGGSLPFGGGSLPAGGGATTTFLPANNFLNNGLTNSLFPPGTQQNLNGSLIPGVTPFNTPTNAPFAMINTLNGPQIPTSTAFQNINGTVFPTANTAVNNGNATAISLTTPGIANINGVLVSQPVSALASLTGTLLPGTPIMTANGTIVPATALPGVFNGVTTNVFGTILSPNNILNGFPRLGNPLLGGGTFGGGGGGWGGTTYVSPVASVPPPMVPPMTAYPGSSYTQINTTNPCADWQSVQGVPMFQEGTPTMILQPKKYHWPGKKPAKKEHKLARVRPTLYSQPLLWHPG
jgi:hypothetical protein